MHCYEGSHTYNTNGCGPMNNYDFPIFEYGHNPANGGNSITGGFVYRGSETPNLQGWYVMADYTSDNFWLIKYSSIILKFLKNPEKPVLLTQPHFKRLHLFPAHQDIIGIHRLPQRYFQPAIRIGYHIFDHPDRCDILPVEPEKVLRVEYVFQLFQVIVHRVFTAVLVSQPHDFVFAEEKADIFRGNGSKVVAHLNHEAVFVLFGFQYLYHLPDSICVEGGGAAQLVQFG